MFDNDKKDVTIDDVNNLITKLQTTLVNYENKTVDEYNEIVDTCESLQSKLTDCELKVQTLEEQIKVLKQADKVDSSKKSLIESHQKELDKVKKNAHKAKENYEKYRKLYEAEKAKGFENKFYALQREFNNIKVLIEKYNVSLKDELGRDNHVILNYYDDDSQDSGFYWILDTVHTGVLSYHEKERNGFPLTEERLIDVEFVLTGTTGVCLQVIFTKFGNFIIPEYKSEKPYGITLGIIKAIENKRDQYLHVLPNHVLSKKINLLRSIKVESVYDNENATLLKQNELVNMYDVTTTLLNLDSTMFTGIDSKLKSMIIDIAIKYLEKQF